jgi:hypothetical protein
MTDEPFYSPTNPGVDFGPREPRPGELLWTMTKKGHTCHAELRPCPWGDTMELQIFADGEFRLGHLHASREWAETEATIKQEALRVKGWTEAEDAGTRRDSKAEQ